jgi:hypothetical protein
MSDIVERLDRCWNSIDPKAREAALDAAMAIRTLRSDLLVAHEQCRTLRAKIAAARARVRRNTMSDNNEWTGQPGVPCEHQNRRSHWLQGPLGEVFICGWIPINKVGIWVRDHATITPANITPQHKYLGPVLTPAEVDARVKEAEAKIAAGCLISNAAEVADLVLLNPERWRGVINDALTNWLSPIEDHETPADALQRLIRLEVMAALDPKVSKSAADLVAQARREALEDCAKWHDEIASEYKKEQLLYEAKESWTVAYVFAQGYVINNKRAAAIRALKGEGNE